MNPNMSIYRRLNPRLLAQVGLGLGLLYWANICLIYISNRFHHIDLKGLILLESKELSVLTGIFFP